MTNETFFTTLAEVTGPRHIHNHLLFPALWKEKGQDKPTLFPSIPYWQFIQDEHHSRGKHFDIDRFSKNPPAPKYHTRVKLTPYHLEDSIDTHQMSVFLSFFRKLKEDSQKFDENNWPGWDKVLNSEDREAWEYHPNYSLAVPPVNSKTWFLANEPVVEDNYLAYAVLIAARLHDVGKVVSRTLKKKGVGEYTQYYFSYSGHNITGFNLLRNTLTHRRLKSIFPHFSADTIERMRIAILLFVYAHQRNEVSDSIIYDVFPLIKYVTQEGKPKLLAFFINALNAFLVADGEGSFTLVDRKPNPYPIPRLDGYYRSIEGTFMHTNDMEEVLKRILWLATNEKPLFVVPIGAPGVGKTTFFNSLVMYMQMHGKSIGVASYDAIRLEMFTEAFPELVGTIPQHQFYARAHEYAQTNLDELNKRYTQKIAKLVENGVDIIYLDNTNTAKKSRNRATSRTSPKNTVEIFFDAGLTAHLAQNKKRDDKNVPELQVFRMYAATIPPLASKKKPPLHAIWFSNGMNNEKSD